MKLILFALGALSTAIEFQSKPVGAFESLPVRFDGDKLIRFKNPSPTLRGSLEAMNLDVWGADLTSIDVHVSSSQLQAVKEAFPAESFDVLSNDVQAEIDQQLQAVYSVESDDWFSNYHRFDEIREWYEKLASDFPKLVKMVDSIGKSFEGRDIFAVHITSQNNKGKKPAIWLQGQIHAREWISGATVQFLSHSFVHGYESDDRIKKILDSTELIIVPCVNPDGYEYTWNTNRLWRKNRHPTNSMFNGVDLNRNWNVHWNEKEGASDMPWSEVYKGNAPASEPETQALVKYFLKFPQIVSAIDFHSYSQLILRPYGFVRSNSPHEKEHKRVGDGMRDIIKKTHGKSYASIPSVNLYPTIGTASDWFYGTQVQEAFGHPVYGFTIELRPGGNQGSNGFLLPPKEIRPTGEEILNAMLFFAEETVENPLK